MAYIQNILIAVDQVANAVLGGWPDETLSSRCYRLNSKPKWRFMEKLVNTLFFFQPDHCHKAYIAEVNRKQTFKLGERL